MRLLFDLSKVQPVNGSKFHGGGKYGQVVFKQLVEDDSKKIAAFYDDTLYIDQALLELCLNAHIPVYKKSDISLYAAAHKEGGVVYSPLFDSAYLKDSSIQVIVTIHGLRTLEMFDDEMKNVYSQKKSKHGTLKIWLWTLKQKFLRRNSFKYEMSKQQEKFLAENIRFVTVSNHSKYSILCFNSFLKDSEVRVFYSPSTVNDVESYPNVDITHEKFFLIVSADRWIKNGARALIAMDQLFSEKPKLKGKVVVTGLKNISDLAIRIKNKNRFECLGYVDETRLKTLYKTAHVLLYPSLNEGFGYPPLEAMHEGCPVITSACSAIPEVCGDAVLYCNPYSLSEIKMRILQMENVDIRESFQRKGLEREKIIRKKQDDDLKALSRYLLSFIR